MALSTCKFGKSESERNRKSSHPKTDTDDVMPAKTDRIFLPMDVPRTLTVCADCYIIVPKNKRKINIFCWELV